MGRRSLLSLGVALALAGVATARDASIDLAPPPAGTFVLDHAGLIDDGQEQEIETLAAALHAEHHTPLIVVTVDAMADHWAHGDIRIETFAHLLFDQWEVGDAELFGETWNTGILLIVSKGDRKARIQLGAGWGREKDRVCQRIMDTSIIPQFKRKRFGAGIIAGAKALDAMARGKSLPASRGSARRSGRGRSGGGASPRLRGSDFRAIAWPCACGGSAVLLLVVLAIRQTMSRTSGSFVDEDGNLVPETHRDGGFWSGVLTTLANTNWSSGGSSWGGGGSFGGGGGFSGGGGGFSGGGGASGSW
jgi:uncharacterized protein